MKTFQEWSALVTVRTMRHNGWTRIESAQTPVGWCQVPHWPCSRELIQAGTFQPERHQEFIDAVDLMAEFALDPTS